MTSKLTLSMSALVFIASTGACSQGPVNIGENNGSAQTKTGLDAYKANWVGYAEAHTFIDGTDTVRIAIAQDGTGTIRFGDRDLWPPASDPNALFPPDFADAVISCPPTAVAWDGFLHPFKNLRVEQERLRASVASNAIFASWCSNQKPIALASGGYSCVNSDPWVPGFGPGCGVEFTSDAGATFTGCGVYRYRDAAQWNYDLVNIPCVPAVLCYDYSQEPNPAHASLHICACTESGCQLSNVPDDIFIDAALDDAQQNMTGTLVIGTGNVTIRLKRQN